MSQPEPQPEAQPENQPDRAAVSAPGEAAAGGGVGLVRPPGPARRMPPDFSLSLAAKGNLDRQLFAPGGAQRQRMRGFENHYTDIIDYIVRITHRIWEEKDVGYIYDTYSATAHVHDDHGLQYGRDKIVADTVHTLNAFPDIRLFADEIVWAGDDEAGFHTSHRTVITGHNTGPSRYGPPTGRKVVLWCVALGNEIFDEWVVYDTAGLVSQLGFDLREQARAFGNGAAQGALATGYGGEPERLPGQGKPDYRPLPGGFGLEDFVRTTLHNVWNRRMVGTVRRAYAPGLRFRGGAGRASTGRGAYQAFVLSLLATFPDLALSVDDLYWMGNDHDGYLTSVRWSAQGTHRGFGVYGPPTGRPVELWGISQHRVRDGLITDEWTFFNEFAVLAQILRD